jgi:pimeloyl-ACP methyl ester carboxylesterase
LVLIGYSMGGSLVTQFMQHSALASRVIGLVLDAPALDWRRILSFQASEMGLPGVAAKPVEWAIGARIDADWGDLDALAHPDALRVPILLFHGTQDQVIPIATSEDLAKELPRWVSFFPAPEADHTEAWNVNPRLYERRLGAFLRRIGAAAPRSPAAGSSSPRSPRG